MSTSPSWFDQDKFSKLIKKKPPAKPTALISMPPRPEAVTPARAPSGPLPPLSRPGSGALPILPSRSGTGPLPPPPRRASGPLPPSSIKATGPLPPPSRPPTATLPPSLAVGGFKAPGTGALPPPPQPRPPTSPLPPPPARATGALPEPVRAPSVRLAFPRPGTGALPPPPVEEPTATLPEEAPPMENEEPVAETMASARASVPLPDFKPLFDSSRSETTDLPALPPENSGEKIDPLTEAPFWMEQEAAAPTDEPAAFHPAETPVESAEVVSEETSTFDPAEQVRELEAKLSAVEEERDQARAELEDVRRRGTPPPASPFAGENLSQAAQERDEARMELIVLRQRLEVAQQTERDTKAMASQLEELSHVIDERDSVRRDFAKLRESFETLKLDRSRLDPSEVNAQLRQEIDDLRGQLARATTGSATVGDNSADAETLRAELKKARDEASMAQRGLALSQKALQETREALREAGEGSSGSKGNFDDLKKERANLVRQNMLLQGQNDQLNRDLSALRAKLAAKGG